MSWRGVVFVVAWAVPGLVMGEELPSSPDAGVEDVPVARTVITASRSPERLVDAPVATEVITRSDIEASGKRDVASLLAAHPGLEVDNTFSGASLRIQGLGPEYALVLVDGERVTGRVAGSVDLSRLSLEDIEQVEIVKGPSSALYGSDAVAGVVNLITRRAQRPLGGDLRLSYGSLQRLELDGTGEARGETWGLRVSGGVQRRNAYDLDPSDVGTTGSSVEGFQLSARGDLRGQGAMDLASTVSISRRIQRGVDLGTAGAVFDRASRDEELNARVAPSWRLGESTTLRTEGHVAWFARRALRDQRQASALDSVEDTREQQGRLGTQLDARLGESHALVAGLELLGERLASDRLEGGRGERGRGALYVQDSWSVASAPRLVLVPGARLDADTQFGAAVTPRLAVRVDPLEWLTVRASYGWGLRAPSFQELLLDFENPTVGYTVNGNPDLRPERSRSASLGVEVRPTPASLLWVSVYQHALRDRIGVSLQQDAEGQHFVYVNVARSKVRGGELGARQRLPGGLLLEATYSLTDGQDQDSGLPLEGQARHRVTAQATWRSRPWGLETWVRGAWIGARPFAPDSDGDGVADPYEASPYVTLDARVARQLPAGLQVFVEGTNLTGAGNPNDLPLAPRSFRAGLVIRH
ncbi:TonB-dependent receptor [Myxococcaceae bacterium JPH2]|nr:TonB-dependent receptor [Myxococcaceae bacterium JPH2]